MNQPCCIVPGCVNREGEGRFEGPICGPCAEGFRSQGKHKHDAASLLLASSARGEDLTRKILALGREAEAQKEDRGFAWVDDPSRYVPPENARAAFEEDWAPTARGYDDLLDGLVRELHIPKPHAAAAVARACEWIGTTTARRFKLWVGQQINGVTPPPDWVGIRSALDHVLANEAITGDTIAVLVELDA